MDTTLLSRPISLRLSFLSFAIFTHSRMFARRQNNSIEEAMPKLRKNSPKELIKESTAKLFQLLPRIRAGRRCRSRRLRPDRYEVDTCAMCGTQIWRLSSSWYIFVSFLAAADIHAQSSRNTFKHPSTASLSANNAIRFTQWFDSQEKHSGKLEKQ